MQTVKYEKSQNSLEGVKGMDIVRKAEKRTDRTEKLRSRLLKKTSTPRITAPMIIYNEAASFLYSGFCSTRYGSRSAIVVPQTIIRPLIPKILSTKRVATARAFLSVRRSAKRHVHH